MTPFCLCSVVHDLISETINKMIYNWNNNYFILDHTKIFYDRMTVHRNRFLVNKTNRCTEFQFYWYCYSTCFGQPFCPSSGFLSRTSALVHFMQLWPFATRSRMELLCIKCTKTDVRLRTPDDGQKGCPKHVE
jgi:hypothetical protein